MSATKKKVATFSLTLEALRLLEDAAKARGLNKSATLETMIREDAKRQSAE